MRSSDSNLDTSTQIACSSYDYVEIACMYRYKIKLVLFEGPDVVATAMDTKLNAQRAECIEVQTAESRCLIELSNIHCLEPLTDNARFGLVVLNLSAASSYSLA